MINIKILMVVPIVLLIGCTKSPNVEKYTLCEKHLELANTYSHLSKVNLFFNEYNLDNFYMQRQKSLGDYRRCNLRYLSRYVKTPNPKD